MESLLLPFEFDFMQQAFVMAIVISVPAALLSCFLVLKGWALMGDAISHAVLPGIVIAYMLSLPLAIGAFVAGMVCALSTGYLKENSRLREDTIMGVVFAGMFAVGLVLYTSIQTDVHLDHILFGNILGISWHEILEACLISLLVTGFLMLTRQDLLLHAFDQQQARAIGLPVRFLHYGLLCMLALTVVAALKAVGIILAIALLISPGAIAFLLTKQFNTMLGISVIVASSASFLGVYASFFLDSAPAPTIVVIMAIWFIIVFLWRSLQISKVIRNENA